MTEQALDGVSRGPSMLDDLFPTDARFRRSMWSSTGAPLVQAWIGDRDLRVTAWSIDGDQVAIAVTGPDAPPPAEPLATSLAEAFGIPVTVEITYVAAVRELATSAP